MKSLQNKLSLVLIEININNLCVFFFFFVCTLTQMRTFAKSFKQKYSKDYIRFDVKSL